MPRSRPHDHTASAPAFRTGRRSARREEGISSYDYSPDEQRSNTAIPLETLRDAADLEHLQRHSSLEYRHTPSSSLLGSAKNQPASRPESGMNVGSDFTAKGKSKVSVKTAKSALSRPALLATRYSLLSFVSIFSLALLLSTFYFLLSGKPVEAYTLGSSTSTQAQLGASLSTQTFDITGLPGSDMTGIQYTPNFMNGGTFGLNATPGNLTFRNSANSVDWMRIDVVNQRVGIGTPSPGSKLHVQTGSAGNVSPHSEMLVTIEKSSTAALGILAPQANESIIYFGSPTSNIDGGIVYNHPARSMIF
ncbi:MAG: hypothetical protein FJY98_04830, partial [Candidatus Liptonbacteria bacterium]|nr:hypothetical protein [Candidatus Liptonbacteria bacterium]